MRLGLAWWSFRKALALGHYLFFPAVMVILFSTTRFPRPVGLVTTSTWGMTAELVFA